ncbi:MAG: shikimate kinase [Clostridium sp.]|nr:shikimate kinase [Clostridium sp.]
MPASGKSTAGVLLAKTLGMGFLDTDLLIQQRCGKLLPQIIEQSGIDGFLREENAALLSVDVENTVVATGGSAVYCGEGMERLREKGEIYFIDISPEEAARRIADITARGVVARPGQSIHRLYEERLPLYKKWAEKSFEANNISAERLVAQMALWRAEE